MWRREPAIDREGRRRAATLLRSLASGRITNDEFADRWPVSPDLAVEEVYWAAWKLYSDLREYRLARLHRLTKAERREVARWVVFLRTDLPYSWPRLPKLPSLFAGIVTAGISSWLVTLWYRRQGDLSSWPFINQAQLNQALANGNQCAT